MTKAFFYNSRIPEAFRCALTGNGLEGLSRWHVITPGLASLTLKEYSDRHCYKDNDVYRLLTIEGEPASAVETATWLSTYCEEGLDYAMLEVRKLMDLGLEWETRPLSLKFFVGMDDDPYPGLDTDDVFTLSVKDISGNIIYHCSGYVSLRYLKEVMLRNLFKLYDAAGLDIVDKRLDADNVVLQEFSEEEKTMFTSINKW